MWIKYTPNSNKPFERWLLKSQWEWISMSEAFTTFLEIVVISIVNANPFIKDTPERKDREERYLKLINLRKDKNIPAEMLADLVNEMQKHSEEKLDILGDMYMKFVSLGENGQFFTPPHIANLLSDITEPSDNDRVLDCACGSGTLLLWALRKKPTAYLYGVDLDRRCVMMALLNCFWYWWRWTFIVWNSLTNEYSEWWRCEYGMIYELKIVDSEKDNEKSKEQPTPKKDTATQEIKVEEIQEVVQQSLF